MGNTFLTGRDGGVRYTTEEVPTGDVWVDGKLIYRKVMAGTPPIQLGSLGIDKVLNVGRIGWARYSQSGYVPNPPVSFNGSTISFTYQGSTTNLAQEYCLSVEYTKL